MSPMWDETGLRCSLFYSLENYCFGLYCIVVDYFVKFQNMGSCGVVAMDKVSLSILAYWMAYALHCICGREIFLGKQSYMYSASN